MEIKLAVQFSKEFSIDDAKLVNNFSNSLQVFFQNKEYGDSISKIYIGVICISESFETFFNIRPPKVYENESLFEFEINLNFNEYMSMNNVERVSYLAQKILINANEVFDKTKIIGFNSKEFLFDLKECYNNNLSILD